MVDYARNLRRLAKKVLNHNLDSKNLSNPNKDVRLETVALCSIFAERLAQMKGEK